MKILLIIMLSFLLTSCNYKNKVIIKEYLTEKLDDSYIEVVPDKLKNYIDLLDDSIILNINEITKYNALIANKSNKIYNLDIASISKDEILKYINEYSYPNNKYYQNRKITNALKEEILNNRNLENITDKDHLKKAITIKRTNLTAFPTNISFFDNKFDSNFDRNQETEVPINTEVVILHESLDQKYFFVLTKTYVGWILQDDVVYASEEEINYFINNPKFGIITDAYIKYDDLILDMGVKLPYEGITKNGYKLIIPVKDAEGALSKRELIIKRDTAHIGYLPYNKRNLYIEAIKYEGIPYSWGSKDFGVDCSGYISNIYKTFGFIFPRNTADQNMVVGKVIKLPNKKEEKLAIIKDNAPSLLYKEGHVLLYLGFYKDDYYVINASGNQDNMKVVIEKLNNLSYLEKINKLVLINN